MEHAQLTEEALQQSAALSEDDDSQRGAYTKKNRSYQSSRMDFDGDRDTDDLEMAESHQTGNGSRASDGVEDEEGEDGEEEEEEEEEDADGEFDDGYEMAPGGPADTSELVGDDIEDGAEGEEDDGDDDEGVGAVKVRPGETDDEGDSASDASEPQSVGSDSEDDAAWEEDEEEDAVEVDEEEDDDERSVSEPANSCILCKEESDADTDGDPGVYLTCTSCGEKGKDCPPKALARPSSLIANYLCSSPALRPNCTVCISQNP